MHKPVRCKGCPVTEVSGDVDQFVEAHEDVYISLQFCANVEECINTINYCVVCPLWDVRLGRIKLCKAVKCIPVAFPKGCTVVAQVQVSYCSYLSY